MFSRINFSITFLGIEVRLFILEFRGFSFLAFLKIGVTFSHFQTSETSPAHHVLSKTVKTGVTVTSTSIPVNVSSVTFHGLVYVQFIYMFPNVNFLK